jgi:hypothetical protein
MPLLMNLTETDDVASLPPVPPIATTAGWTLRTCDKTKESTSPYVLERKQLPALPIASYSYKDYHEALRFMMNESVERLWLFQYGTYNIDYGGLSDVW